MRFLICFLLSLALLSFVDAGCYKEGRRPDAIKKKLTEKELYSAATAKPSPVKSLDELPRNHDWCNVDGKSYCSVSWNQHIPQYCGACWVHGALGQANDRIKIQLNALHDNNLARQVILNCGKSKGYGEGCNGGEAYDIFEYMHRYGLPDETCQNYVAKESETCDDAAICHNCMPIGEEIFPYRCWAVKPPIMYRVKEYGTVKGEAAMMSEILARGPITCGFVTTDEFDYNYRGGVYIDRSNSTDVNHDVEVVGWGEENGVKYWKARNSWGTYWGENGFFRILRGENNALFEDECVFAIFDTHEVEDVLDGTKKGSMYGIYSPDNLHKLPTPVQIEKYGKNDPRVYDDVKQSSAHHQGQEKETESTTLLDTAKLSEAGVDALSYGVKGGEKIGAQATNQAQNAEKYIKAGEENAAKFASQYKDMAKGFASSGKDYAKMAEKYASMQGNSGNSGKGHGKGGSNTPDYMKWAGSYQQGGGYSNYQGGQGGSSMKTGAKANVDEIKAAGKLSKQFIPNGNNYYKSPSTSSFADKQELSAAIVNAFVEKKDHDHDNNAEEANAKETEEAIRHAIEEAFADEKADKKQTAEKIKTAIIAALNDIKVHVKEHGNTIKESASSAAKEEADEAKQAANDIANRVKSLGKEISDDIHEAAEKSKENEAAHQDAIQQEKPQSLIDSAAVADGVVSPSSSSSFPTVLGLCVTGVVLGGLYYGYQKKRENSYQML